MSFRSWIAQNKVDFTSEEGFSSKALFNEVVSLAPSTRQRLQSGVQWIVSNAIDCTLIGGAAVVHYISSARPLTPDMDFLTNHVADVQLKAQGQGLTVEPLHMVSTIPVDGVTIEEFNIDFVDANTGNSQLYQYALKTARTAMIGGANLKVISPDVLAIMKLSLGREKDDNDAFMILQSGVITKAEFKASLQALKSAVYDAKSLWQYSYMIPR